MEAPERAPAAAPTVVYRPPSGPLDLRLGEVFRHRELVYFLLLRTLKLRYRQTALGVLWAVLQPLAVMALFTALFGRTTPSRGVPYPLYVLVALLPWQVFSQALSFSSQSIITSQHLVSKVAFPRLVLPIASVLAGVVDLAAAFLVLVPILIWYGHVPGASLAALPLFILLDLVAAFGIAFWLSALVVRFRDVKFTLPFLTQLWMFATPLFYDPATLVPERLRFVYELNPLVGVVEGFRWAILGIEPASWEPFWISAASALALLVTGTAYFRRSEAFFADTI